MTFGWTRLVTRESMEIVLPIRASLIQVLLGCLLLWTLVAPRGSSISRFFRSRWLMFLGTYSYGLYVYHHFISYYLTVNQTEFELARWLGSHGAAVALQATAGVAVCALPRWRPSEMGVIRELPQLETERDGAVLTIRLANEKARNALSRDMRFSLREVIREIEDDRTIRAVYLTGKGAAFCAGGDIAEYPAFRFDETRLRDFHERDVWGGLQALLECDVPLVAQIEGACMGAGLELASCCDIRIAGESATFGAPIARLGFPMAPRELQLVTHAAGELTVREMLLEAAVLDASEMKRRGFLNRVVPEGAVAAEAAETAQRVARLAPQAARLNKQALARWRESKWAEARSGIAQGATELIADAYGYAASGEHREGVTAFLEKRKPVF